MGSVPTASLCHMGFTPLHELRFAVQPLELRALQQLDLFAVRSRNECVADGHRRIALQD